MLIVFSTLVVYFLFLLFQCISENIIFDFCYSHSFFSRSIVPCFGKRKRFVEFLLVWFVLFIRGWHPKQAICYSVSEHQASTTESTPTHSTRHHDKYNSSWFMCSTLRGGGDGGRDGTAISIIDIFVSTFFSVHWRIVWSCTSVGQTSAVSSSIGASWLLPSLCWNFRPWHPWFYLSALLLWRLFWSPLPRFCSFLLFVCRWRAPLLSISTALRSFRAGTPAYTPVRVQTLWPWRCRCRSLGSAAGTSAETGPELSQCPARPLFSANRVAATAWFRRCFCRLQLYNAVVAALGPDGSLVPILK